ncbi:MAG: hypothetical protein AAFY71_00580 [Bacteroidota bacterium]
MSRNLVIILSLIFAAVSFFVIPIPIEMDPIIYGVIKGAIALAVFGILFYALQQLGYLALALTLAAILIFAPEPYALPIDGIAKFIVALTVVAIVLGIEKRLKRKQEEVDEEASI